MDAARARDGEEDPGLSGEVAVRGGGVPGGLLVVEGDEADAERHGSRGQGRDGDPDDAEHVRDAEVG